jgi:branched-chain amino acid transport system permease protein
MSELVKWGWAAPPLPLGVNIDALGNLDFLIEVVGLTAGIYALFTLGLQLNVGFSGIINFGQAGFMAVGAYSMGLLVVDAGLSFWLAMPLAMVIAVAFGLLVGLPSVRLRADYLAIATIAAAEIVRLFANSARDLTGGNQGFSCAEDDPTNCYDATWRDEIEDPALDSVEGLGWTDAPDLFPLFVAVWVAVIVVTGLLYLAQRTPWGRVLRAVREDEDAARALGKNTFAYKLQSLSISAAIAAIAGFFLALNLSSINPASFDPLFTFIGYGILVLGGLANYWGIAVGSILMWLLIEGSRQVELVPNPEKQAALRFIFVGLLLILLMAFRPQGLFGKREEMVLGD